MNDNTTDSVYLTDLEQLPLLTSFWTNSNEETEHSD